MRPKIAILIKSLQIRPRQTSGAEVINKFWSSEIVHSDCLKIAIFIKWLQNLAARTSSHAKTVCIFYRRTLRRRYNMKTITQNRWRTTDTGIEYNTKWCGKFVKLKWMNITPTHILLNILCKPYIGGKKPSCRHVADAQLFSSPFTFSILVQFGICNRRCIYWFW